MDGGETELARLEAEFEEKAAWANQLNAELADAQANVHEFRSRAQDLQSKIQGLQSRVDELGALWSRATSWKRALIFSVFAPLDWMVGGVIIAVEIFGRVLRRISSRKAPLVAAQNSAQSSIVIVTW